MNYVIMVMKLNKMVLDNKKIEEAAINKCGFISSEFYSGAKWAINEFLKDLWHDASETPDLDRRILYEYKPNGVINPQTHIREATYEKIHWKECGYKPINPERIITRWLYVDELCPKKGGEK